jgi:hypothetical protein
MRKRVGRRAPRSGNAPHAQYQPQAQQHQPQPQDCKALLERNRMPEPHYSRHRTYETAVYVYAALQLKAGLGAGCSVRQVQSFEQKSAPEIDPPPETAVLKKLFEAKLCSYLAASKFIS